MSRIHEADTDSDLAMYGEGSTQERWLLSLQFLLISHTTQSLPDCLWHLLSHRPSSRIQSLCLVMKESVPGHLKETAEFQTLCCLTWRDKILRDFHSHMLFGLFFLTLVLWQGALCEARTPCSSRGTSAAKICLLILKCHM